MEWSYGVMTCSARVNTLLPRTLQSLVKAGFDKPRLFIDGASCPQVYSNDLGLELTLRFPAVRTAANWWLSIVELYVRSPLADRYLLFQDDLVTYHGLREYLERCWYPPKGYCNLYTFPANQQLLNGQKEPTEGWFKSNQRGLGAVALMFDRNAVMMVAQSQYLLARFQDKAKGHKSIDGGIVTALKNVSIHEYVHNPSLVQHIGEVSAMGNGQHPQAPSFKGEDFDANLLNP